jgi:pilus assembly protein CpaF
LCIRRFTENVLPLAAFCNADVVRVLRSLIDERLNIVVSGPTSSGKTSLLASLATLLPPSERIVTIEDTAELRITLPHVVRLESRPANSENHGAVTLDHLVRTAMRLRPDRIIVGEVRGNEVVDMLSALSTGHDGSWTTVHSNNPQHTLTRLETLTMRSLPNFDPSAARRMVREAIHAIVHLDKGANGERRVVDVVRVLEHGERVLVSAGECTDTPR